jgi:hypothetical protein
MEGLLPMRPLGGYVLDGIPGARSAPSTDAGRCSWWGWVGGQISIADAAGTTHVIVRRHGLRARRIDVTHGENANYRPCSGTDGS